MDCTRLIEALAKLILAVAVLVLAIGFYLTPAPGRYTFARENDLDFVFDTATGTVHQAGYGLNHVTGEERLPKQPGK